MNANPLSMPIGSQPGNPLVSVILPVFNGEAFIANTLESALLQTYENIEIIVIDDGSTDGTVAVVKNFLARDSRVRLIRQLNAGVARARNCGIAVARGEFVAPLDADDLWEPTKIERQVHRMLEEGEGTGLVYCWWVWIDENGAVLDRSPSWHTEGNTLETLLQVNFTGNASVPLYRRALLAKVGGYDEALAARSGPGCEDWDVALKVAAQSRVAVVPALLVGYRRRTGSMSTSCQRMWQSQVLVVEGLRQRNESVPEAVLRRSRQQFALYLAGIAFWSGAYLSAFAWAFRALPSVLILRVFPYAVRVILFRMNLLRRGSTQIMMPGQALDARGVPEPLIPYDRIYHRDGTRGQGKNQNPPPGGNPPSRPLRSRIDTMLRSRTLQSFAVLLLFFAMAAMRADNDGLWYQGDAPRHGANGFFWWDLLKQHASNPVDFAVRYYARYPVVSPATYPPLFYLIEGLAFDVFGPSPYVARLAVLAFAILLGVYTMAWARRWIGTWAGWAGALLALMPGIIVWSNAIMLNIPASAIGMAFLYHFRRWNESGEKRQLTLTVVSLAAALLTYYAEVMVVCVALAWALLPLRSSRAPKHGLLWVFLALFAGGVPVLIASGLAPFLAARHLPDLSYLNNIRFWLFYFKALPELVGPALLTLGVGGLAAGFMVRRWRKEAVYAAAWMLVVILSYSILPARDARYILLVSPAFVFAALIGLASVSRLAFDRRPVMIAASLALLLGIGLWSATGVNVPKVTGFHEIAEYLQRNSQFQDDAVLYDGHHDGVFSFYVRASDPGFTRRVVLGDSLLYYNGPTTDFHWVETSHAASIDEVVNIVRVRCGCRWLAIETGPRSEWSVGQRLLRQAITRPEFEWVRSFPVVARGAERVDLYRIADPVLPVETIDLKFPGYSDRAFLQIAPITR